MSSIYYKNQKYTGPTLDLGSGSLTTDDKTIVGAINELDAEVGAINAKNYFNPNSINGQLTWSSDFNEATSTGMYYVNTWAGTQSATAFPRQVLAVMVVLSLFSDGSVIHQLVFSTTCYGIRSRTNGTWGAWKTVTLS